MDCMKEAISRFPRMRDSRHVAIMLPDWLIKKLDYLARKDSRSRSMKCALILCAYVIACENEGQFDDYHEED